MVQILKKIGAEKITLKNFFIVLLLLLVVTVLSIVNRSFGKNTGITKMADAQGCWQLPAAPPPVSGGSSSGCSSGSGGSSCCSSAGCAW